MFSAAGLAEMMHKAGVRPSAQRLAILSVKTLSTLAEERRRFAVLFPLRYLLWIS